MAYGMTKKWGRKHRTHSAARLYAVQALFQMEASDRTVDEVRREFEKFRIGLPMDDGMPPIEGDADLFRKLTDAAVEQQVRIDRMIDRALVAKWPINRIDPTVRALFRAAGAELLEGLSPPRVVITEFVDVAGAFFPGGREAQFANAVLDHMAREAQPGEF